MRKTLVALAVALLAVVACDRAVKEIAEERAGERLTRALGLGSPARVSFGGFPFTLALLRGHIASVGITASDVGRGGLRVARAELELSGLSFSLGDLAAGRTRTVRTAGGRGEAEISDDAIAALLVRRGVPLQDLSFQGGRVLVAGPRGRAEGRLEVRGRRLVLSAPGLGEVALALPGLGGRVTYEGVRIGAGVATLGLRLAPGRLQAP